MPQETMRPVGSNLLCTRAKKREQMKDNIHVPIQGPEGQKRRKQDVPRVLELTVAGVGEPRNEDEESYVKGISVGDRIAVANSPISIVFLNGEEHIIIDAQFVEGVIDSGQDAAE